MVNNLQFDSLLLNQVDNAETDIRVEEDRRSNFFLCNRKSLRVFLSSIALSILLVLTLLLTLPRKTITQFNLDLKEIAETQELSQSTKDLYIYELTELYKDGLISSDHVMEFEIIRGFYNFNQRYPREHKSFEGRMQRFLNYRSNFIKVNEHNSMNGSYTMKLNKFSDWTVNEINSLLNSIPSVPEWNITNNFDPAKLNHNFCPVAMFLNNKTYLKKLMAAKGLDHIADPCEITGDGIDWRKGDGVTPVKDQGNCGSCWAFATVGAVEATWLIHAGKTLNLSEQELVSCHSKCHACFGCPGISTPIQYIIEDGISKAEYLPYVAKKERCDVHTTDKIYIDDYAVFWNEDIVKYFLPIAPVIVQVAADNNWLLYSGGIYNGSCAETVTHDVLLVGEGYDETLDKHYWIIKNSWGQDWGEDGYMRLERTYKGHDKCSILKIAVLPLLYNEDVKLPQEHISHLPTL